MKILTKKFPEIIIFDQKIERFFLDRFDRYSEIFDRRSMGSNEHCWLRPEPSNDVRPTWKCA